MNNNITLSEANKKKTTLTVLSVIGIILLIAAVCVSISAHKTLSLVMFVIAALVCIIAYGYAMYLTRKITQTKEQRLPVSKLMHSLALHALLAVTALFAVVTRELVFTVYHAAAEGLLAAVLIFTAAMFVCDKYGFYKKIWFAALVALITALLSGFKVELAVHIILIVLSLIAVIALVSSKKNASMFKGSSIITALVSMACVIWHIISPSNGMPHMVLHTAVMALGALMALGICSYLIKEYEAYLDSLKAEKTIPAKGALDALEKPRKKPTAAKNKNDGDILNVNLAVVKAYENKSFKELLNSPTDALQGVSADDAKLLKDAFGVDTIGELAELKYAQWAQSIVLLAELEDKEDK